AEVGHRNVTTSWAPAGRRRVPPPSAALDRPDEARAAGLEVAIGDAAARDAVEGALAVYAGDVAARADVHDTCHLGLPRRSHAGSATIAAVDGVALGGRASPDDLLGTVVAGLGDAGGKQQARESHRGGAQYRHCPLLVPARRDGSQIRHARQAAADRR